MFEYSTNKGKDFATRIKALIPHIGKDDMVPVLNTARFYVEDGKLWAEATNRFTLGRAELGPIEAGSEDGGSFLMDSATVKELVKVATGSPTWVQLKFNANPGFVEIISATGTRTVGHVDGDYPKLRKLIPDYVSEPPSATPDMLLLGVQHLAAFGPSVLGSKVRNVQFMLGAPGKPIRVEIPGEPWFTGVIMPNRLDHPFYGEAPVR